MKIGFGAPVSGAWATPENLARFAARAEQAGYASLWSFQRLLVPEGSGMDQVYRSVLDPLAALAYAAAGTSRIRLGVAVINLPFVAPAHLGKQAGTGGVLSGGRVCRGVVRVGAEAPAPAGDGRLLLSGSPDQIRADTRWLADQGVTEVFYDLNWDPLVGSPGADPAAATARAEEILEVLAPAP